MTNHPSLFRRIAIAKLAGFGIGAILFALLPLLAPRADPMLGWGIWLWYITMGAVIGVSGIYTRHPVLNLPLPWWLRAPLIGGWMNFVLVFFVHAEMRVVLEAIFGPGGALTSPFWFVVEGMALGALIGWLATRYGGEGRAAIDETVA